MAKRCLASTGDIICANYHDMYGKETVGMFLVIYDEETDDNTEGVANVMALKITSNLEVNCNYKVPVYNETFDKKCVVVCSKVHTLHKKNIFKVLSKLDGHLMLRVLCMFNKYMSTINAQIGDVYEKGNR